MNANDPIALLNASENDIARRTTAAAAPPSNGIAAKAIAEIPRIDAIEHRSQIEMPALGTEFELPLHGTLRRQRVPFSGILGHRFGCWFPLGCFVRSFGHDPKFWGQN
jgi:hypothetical protein